MTLEGITRRDAFHYAIKHLPTKEVLTGTRAKGMLKIALDCGKSAFFQEIEDHHSDLLELRDALASATQKRATDVP